LPVPEVDRDGPQWLRFPRSCELKGHYALTVIFTMPRRDSGTTEN
jgi:hypothetical protein